MAEKVIFRDLSPGLVARLRATAQECLPFYDPKYDAGFSLLGGRAKQVIEKVRQLALDEGCVAEYI